MVIYSLRIDSTNHQDPSIRPLQALELLSCWPSRNTSLRQLHERLRPSPNPISYDHVDPAIHPMSRRVSKVFKARTKDFLDLSEGFDRRLLSNAENLARYGISGDIVAASYDQVQSLLALATPRSIHVLGQNGVEVVYKVHAGRDIAFLVLHASHLVAIDFKNTLYSWLLEGGDTEPVAVQSLRGVVTATHVDPSLDWLFLGMKDGTVQAWDLAGEQMNTTFKVKNQYFERQEEWVCARPSAQSVGLSSIAIDGRILRNAPLPRFPRREALYSSS